MEKALAPFSKASPNQNEDAESPSQTPNSQEAPFSKPRASVLVVFYSILGHTYDMALAEAEGAKSVEGVRVDIRRVKEIFSKEEMEVYGGLEASKKWEHVPIAKPEEVVQYDAIIFGTPVHFGLMSIQMKAFIQSLMIFWESNKLQGKLAGVFASSGCQRIPFWLLRCSLGVFDGNRWWK